MKWSSLDYFDEIINWKTGTYKHKMNVSITIIIIIIGINIGHKTCSKVSSCGSNLEYCDKENSKGLNLICRIILKQVSGKNLTIMIKKYPSWEIFYLEVSFYMIRNNVALDPLMKSETKLKKNLKKISLAFKKRKKNGMVDSWISMCCYLKLSQNGRIKVRLEAIFLIVRRL